MKQQVLFALVLGFLAAPAWGEEQKAVDPERAKVVALMEEMVEAAKGVKDYTMLMIKAEGFEKKMNPKETIRVKWARPHKIYLKNVKEPYKNREVVFMRGRNDNELTAHKGSFPDITADLDPYGSMAMDGNHHPITQASLIHFVKVLEVNLRKAHKRGEGQASILPQQKLWGRSCTKLELKSARGGFFHTMKDDQTLWQVARQYHSDMYFILHHNMDKGWDEADDPDEGDKVFIPRYYASRIEVWIDDELKLPIKALIYDHYGRLYEDYEHRDLKINVGLKGADFSTKNPAYNF